ncbi:hypothetical protein ACLGL2_05480 [Parvimonas sp. G1641]|uniref:hypothetical protein n=1 Tax=Parvimonas sp. G1641 TaxID=3388846 RepID=UPI0039810576
MLKKSNTILLICGLTSIAITILLYLLTFNYIFNIPIIWISLCFLILSEVIGTFKVLKIKKSIFGVSTIITSIIHIFVVLILSIIFINTLPLAINRYILINILLICILLIVDISILKFDTHVANQNTKLDESKLIIENCITKSSSLALKSSDSDYKKDLDEIVDLLKYSDSSCLLDDEISILNKLDEVDLLLKNNTDASKEIIEIKNIIKMRAIKISNTKRGSY